MATIDQNKYARERKLVWFHATCCRQVCFYALGLLAMLGCDSTCISQTDIFWDPAEDEYRLEISNRSDFMVKLTVDGEDQGVYCDGVDQLPVGNFLKSECSRIVVTYLDNPSELHLDDCDIFSQEDCRENNTDGRTCYDTRIVERVEAKVGK